MTRLLLDTHILLWAANDSHRLSEKARHLIEDSANEVLFSVASLWEVALKAARHREDFRIDAAKLRAQLCANGFLEVAIGGAHVLLTSSLPAFHKDPFDRLLIAQAMQEGLTLVTSDTTVARYSSEILQV